ncbi:MAG: 3D domain-containing protein [Candidatus Moraniibacteriota bacterium]|nr:MAG: 3D domain-containing protein [Candidatus Moranbacteria bacterium]
MTLYCNSVLRMKYFFGSSLFLFSLFLFTPLYAIAETESGDLREKDLLYFYNFDRTQNPNMPVYEGIIPYSEEQLVDLEYERKMSLWRKKQENRWKNLSEENFVINASAYTASADECGKSDGITASGVKVEPKRTLACPPEYPFGVKISIDGMGMYTCEDRGGAIKGNKFDIYMETKKEAIAFGRRNLEAKVIR